MDNKTKKVTVLSDEEADKYRKEQRHKTAIWVVLSILLFIVVLVPWHFAVKSCSDLHTKTHTVSVVQPESSEWELKVNEKQGSFKVREQDTLDVTVTPKTSFYEAIDSLKTTNEDVCYYVQVAPTSKKETPTWRNELIFVSEEKGYKASFPMAWTYDITVSIVVSSAYQDSYYTKNNDGSEIAYLYDKSTIYNPNLNYVTRIKVEDESAEKISKSEFTINVGDGKLWIGDKIPKLSEAFLEGCTAFNSPIVFPEKGMLETIEGWFMYNCTSFNQPMNLPSTLKTIKGHFMYSCRAFNSSIDLSNVEDLSKCLSFMAVNTSFNQPITFGSKINEIPPLFLTACSKFNQDVTIPETVTKMNYGFLSYCNDMTSTLTINCEDLAFSHLMNNENMCSTSNKNANCITQGIKLAGKNKHSWKIYFPNLNLSSDVSNETFYRNLIEL